LHVAESLMADDLYALEKLGEALHELATHPGRVQERLGAAWMYLHRIEPDKHLSDAESRRLFDAIKDDLTFEQPVGNEDRLTATLRGLSDEDARDIAARIWRLHSELRDQIDDLSPGSA
jgi:hypothetical protein